MAIDWKTIISEFDGKPTLLQAISKLRKAVEDETITIQQAQAEIAKLESQQKADETLITKAQSTADEAKINAYNASQKGDQALGKATTADTKAQAADTKAQQALDNLNNKQDKITQTTNLSCRKIKTDSLSFTMELGSDSNEYDYGLLFASKNVASTGQLKPSFVDENFFEWLLPAKSGTLATTDDIPASANSKLYRHKIMLNMKSNVYASSGDQAYIDLIYLNVYSSDSTPYTDVQDFYKKQGGGNIGFSCPSVNVVSKEVSSDKAHPFSCCFLGTKGASGWRILNFYAYYKPTTHLTNGYILYIAADLQNAIQDFIDSVEEV